MRTAPPTPTPATRAPSVLTLYGSSSTPSSMLAAPLNGVWPPLRMANLHESLPSSRPLLKDLTAADTSLDDLATTMQDGRVSLFLRLK